MYTVVLFSKTINAFEKISSTYFLWTNMQIKTFRPLKTIYHRDCTVITPTIVPWQFKHYYICGDIIQGKKCYSRVLHTYNVARTTGL